MVLKDPWILFFIPAALYLVFLIRRTQKPAAFLYSSKDLLKNLRPSWKMRFQNISVICRYIVIVLFLVALAGPRKILEKSAVRTKGVDIVLALDASGSMAAEDFILGGQRYNRLYIIKDVVKEFIKQRENDRLGLVTFGSLAYTVCPLTTDHDWLLANLDRIEIGLVEDGTAIGSAIATSVSRLKNSKAKSKVIILLTDGMNNAGEIDPVEAARIAETYGIKIYTIGAGSKGYVPFPAVDMFGRKVYQKVLLDIDEETLTKIADVTHGKYFRATDTESLKRIYKEIDSLEKVEIEQQGYKEYRELFPIVLTLALIVLLVEIILNQTIFLKVP